MATTTQAEWIRTMNQLPDDDLVVLAYSPQLSGEPVWLAVYEGETDTWRWIDGSACTSPITHWMHMPEPPGGN